MLRAAGFPIEGLSDLAAPSYAAAADELVAAGGGGGKAAPPDQRLRDVARDAWAREATVLRRTAADPLFREAVTWQNCEVRRVAIDPYARTTPESPRNQRFRHRGEVVAKYWHRYAAKNDTIGFFGPVCWATVVDGGEPVTVEPGPNLLRRRTVYLERWCVEAYARVLARDPEVRPWLPPHQHVHQYLDGRTVHRPPHPPVHLRPSDAGVLALCDGQRPAQEVARLAVADRELGLRSEADVLLVLQTLAQQNLVVWDVELPMELFPERRLRQHLERIEPEAIRARALAGLERLEQGRDAVASAAGAVERLDAALDELARTFTDLTGAEATRSPGQAYAGRTLVYEDTRRDLDVRIGPGLLGAVGPALGLLLTGARWLTAETERAYRQVLRQAFEDEVRPDEEIVELGQLWPWIQAALFNTGPRPIDAVMDEFVRRWNGILGLDPGSRRVQLHSADLRAAVASAFPAGGPGWPAARHHSADLQIDAPDVQAVNAGEFQVVLGELHTAWNTLDVNVMAGQHDDVTRLLEAVEADMPEPRVQAVLPDTWPRRTGRTVHALVRDADLQLGWTPAPPPSKGHLLRLGELMVEDRGGRLTARTRDGRLTLDPIELIGSFLSELVVDAYKTAFAGAGAHVPRTSIDRLVISRESWRLPVEDLAFVHGKDEVERFVGARAWRKRHGLPEHVFVGLASETKPFGVDLRSPVQVEALGKAVRSGQAQTGQTGTVLVTEMLPGPDGAWVPDREGLSYVSELRLQFVDPVPFRRS